MKALLNALQEGRLIELPDNIKNDALEFLGTLLEAIPEVSDEGINEKALARENLHNTGIGKGMPSRHNGYRKRASLRGGMEPAGD